MRQTPRGLSAEPGGLSRRRVLTGEAQGTAVALMSEPFKGLGITVTGGKASGSHSFLPVFIPSQGSPPRLRSLFGSGTGPPQGST